VVVHEMEAPARRLGVELLRLPVNGADEIPKAFEGADSGRAEAIVLVDDALITQHRSAITDLAAKRRLPVFAIFKTFVESGALMAYGPSAPALYRRVADYVARILNGANPGELPVEQPAVLKLVLNRKVAHALGLELSPSLLSRADEVIE
jgi:putative ABC transport system substrate-binding protein